MGEVAELKPDKPVVESPPEAPAVTTIATATATTSAAADQEATSVVQNGETQNQNGVCKPDGDEGETMEVDTEDDSQSENAVSEISENVQSGKPEEEDDEDDDEDDTQDSVPGKDEKEVTASEISQDELSKGQPEDEVAEDVDEDSQSSSGKKNGSVDEDTAAAGNEESQDAPSEVPTSQGDDEEEMEVDASQSETNDDDSQESVHKETSEGAEESFSSKQVNGEKEAADDVQVITSDEEGSPKKKLSDPQPEAMEVDGKLKPTAEKDDEAVVIGSDSEEESEKTKPAKKPAAEPKSAAPSVDDDDCVLIDDDDEEDKSSNQSTSRANHPRKSAVTVRNFGSLDTYGDVTEIIDDHDDEPAAKRQKTSNSIPPTQIGQITIRDARSLMQESSPQTVKDTVTITPTSSQNANKTLSPSSRLSGPSQPPKLVPVSSPNPAVPALNNANLLPGLTDDMFVLEAPSFIVPYIYEKPPADNLREVVTKIQEQFDLKEEEKENEEMDISTAEKPAPTTSKSNKKKKSGDDSWDESEESGQDDDESDSEPRTKVLIKEADDDLSTLKAAIKPTTALTKTKTGDGKESDNYFESPLGKFFMDIGVGLVQEFVQCDLLRMQKRKLRKSTNPGEQVMLKGAVQALGGNLEASKKRNAPFKFHLKRCEYCSFKSESALAMAQHYTSPHLFGVMYKCNFCPVEIRSGQEMLFHMEAMHNVKGRIEKGPSYHSCPNCPYEDNGKSKLARHAVVCAKKYRPEVNLAPPQDWEAPAKIPRIKPRHGLVGTATAYQAMAAQAAAQKAAMASIQVHQQQRPLANNNANPKQSRSRAPTVPKNATNGNSVLRNPAARGQGASNVILPNNFQIQGGQLIQVSGSGLAILPNAAHNTITLQSPNTSSKKSAGQQPSISITPLPRQSNAGPPAAHGAVKQAPPGMKPGQSPSGAKGSFVICEICDGYIKDLEQLRNHMQWMHKVKIHPKMIYNRPPLNCQKCQFRFFTDQGLERHLLGSHGLVTSSMQEAANKGKDAGRCPLCGRMYQWKLLNHVSRDHYMTLKPAHLSYKCTVCTATFGMYKQFENHVYTAHSTVAKKAMDGKKNSAGSSSSSGLSSRNESLLKPLKINDEITIIPQPPTKTRSSANNIESHVID